MIFHVEHTCTDADLTSEEHIIEHEAVVPCWCTVGHDHTHEEYR